MMAERNTSERPPRSGLPSGLRGMAGLIVIVVISFFLGAWLFGGGGSGDGGGHEGHTDAAVSTVWTCSMHPQIKLPKAGKCPICFMDLIPLETSTDDELGPRQLRLSDAARQLASIETTPVVRAFGEAEVRMTGRIDYDETRVSYITAWVPGRLDRLWADYTGVRVAQGDPLVAMYSPELIAAQEEFLQARTAVASLKGSSSRVLHASTETTLVSARDKLRLLGLSESQIAELERSGQADEQLTINAPIGGVVVHMNAREGMYVTTGTKIYTIADLSRLWVLFEAYESDLPWLRYGQTVSFSSTSFPGESYTALISFIDPVVDPASRTVRIRAVVDNSDGRLKPDMFVAGTVHSRIDDEGKVINSALAGKWISPMHPEIVRDGPGTCDICGMALVTAESLGFASGGSKADQAPLLIPATAPLITGRRAVVYVSVPNDDGPLFEGRVVKLGPRAGNFYIIISGLSEGEMVVTKGAFKLDSELQIQARPSMMSHEGGVAPPAHHEEAGQTGHQVPNAPAMKMEPPANESQEAVASLSAIYTAYFELQMALALDSLAVATEASVRLVDQTEAIDASQFTRGGTTDWKALAKRISGRSAQLAKAETFETARNSFFHLSQAVLDLHTRFGHSSDHSFYLTHCPMARDGDGADWLQNVNVVWNSFYGEMMQHCGEIKQPLEPKSFGEK